MVALVMVAGLNGVPIGAKFLSQSILADIIDYDEFLAAVLGIKPSLMQSKNPVQQAYQNVLIRQRGTIRKRVLFVHSSTNVIIVGVRNALGLPGVERLVI